MNTDIIGYTVWRQRGITDCPSKRSSAIQQERNLPEDHGKDGLNLLTGYNLIPTKLILSPNTWKESKNKKCNNNKSKNNLCQMMIVLMRYARCFR